MEFFLSVAFLINDVERRFTIRNSFQECSQAREGMVKDETVISPRLVAQVGC